MTDPTYDPVLASRLRAYAEGGVRPIDVVEIAEGAIANRRTRTRRNVRPALTLLAAAFLIVGAAWAALVGGATTSPRRRQVRSSSATRTTASDRSGASTCPRMNPPSSSGCSGARPSPRMAGISPGSRHAPTKTTGSTSVTRRPSGTWSCPPRPGVGHACIRLTTVPRCYDCPNSTFTWSPGGRWVSWVDCAGVETCHLVVSASDGSSRKVLQPSFFAPDVNREAWLFWPRDDQLIVRLPGSASSWRTVTAQTFARCPTACSARIPRRSMDGRGERLRASRSWRRTAR